MSVGHTSSNPTAIILEKEKNDVFVILWLWLCGFVSFLKNLKAFNRFPYCFYFPLSFFLIFRFSVPFPLLCVLFSHYCVLVSLYGH